MKNLIKIKETSKSGVIANINGVIGQLRNGTFVAYTDAQLANKTAYKDEWGWENFTSLEEYFLYRKNFNAERKIENEKFAAKVAENRKIENAKLQEMNSNGAIPTTVENVRLVLRFLNEQNWGGWSLPKMTIGYSANQYDCDGYTATTIKLDSPISDEEMEITKETMFKIGGKRGHLEKYQAL